MGDGQFSLGENISGFVDSQNYQICKTKLYGFSHKYKFFQFFFIIVLILAFETKFLFSLI